MSSPVIDIQNVTLRRGEKLLLDDISWRVDTGQHWAIVGANGSGKTTLLRMACGYIWPSTGNVEVLGKKFGETDIRQLRKRIGWVSSSLGAMIHRHYKAMDVVLSGPNAAIGIFDEPSKDDIQKAQALAEQFSFSHIADSTFGILSAGEQQKILIARALMSDPELLILDEACAGLDLRARETLLEQIENLANNSDINMIFVTHHIEEILPAFSHVLLLDKGKKVADAPKAEVLTSKILSEVLKLKMSVELHENRYWPKMLKKSD